MSAQQPAFDQDDVRWMGLALRLAKRGYGRTAPNPMVGAVLVANGNVLGTGWHRRAGEPHAEIEALRDARRRANSVQGATLYVTLEPCSTYGRTPPCTEAILKAGIRRVVAATTDPNPNHAGRGFELLRNAGVAVLVGPRQDDAVLLNEAFNHWVVHRTPWVTVKAAMTLDGKIATISGQSRWITGNAARAFSMRLRQGADAILVGVNTILADNPRLTVRRGDVDMDKPLRRIVLDTHGRTSTAAHVVSDARAELTTIVVSDAAPQAQLEALQKQCAHVWVAPAPNGRIDLGWLLPKLGQETVTHLLVEGGGEVNGSFLMGGFVHRIAFFYAPKLLGGRTAPTAVGADGIDRLDSALSVTDCRWRRLGEDFLLTARLRSPQVQSSDVHGNR